MFAKKRWIILALLVASMLVAYLINPPQAIGAPLRQNTVTPRPTSVLPTHTPGPTPTWTTESPTATPPPLTPEATLPPSDLSVRRKIDLALVADKEQAHPGDSLVYKIQVANVAGELASNVWLTCDLPEGVEIEPQGISTTLGRIHQYGQRISIEMGQLQASFDSQFVQIKTRIRPDLLPGAVLIHRANLTSDQAGGGVRTSTTSAETQTIIVDAAPSSANPQAGKAQVGPLPATGGSAWLLWVVIGFVVLIVVAAIWGSRERAPLNK